MPTPEPNPNDPRPDQAATPNHDQNASGKPGTIPESTQENMGDGSGIRGDYGDSSQTNGLEGGPDEVETDTELTGA